MLMTIQAILMASCFSFPFSTRSLRSCSQPVHRTYRQMNYMHRNAHSHIMRSVIPINAQTKDVWILHRYPNPIPQPDPTECVKLPDGLQAIDVAAYLRSTCAISDNNQILCWVRWYSIFSLSSSFYISLQSV